MNGEVKTQTQTTTNTTAKVQPATTQNTVVVPASVQPKTIAAQPAKPVTPATQVVQPTAIQQVKPAPQVAQVTKPVAQQPVKTVIQPSTVAPKVNVPVPNSQPTQITPNTGSEPAVSINPGGVTTVSPSIMAQELSTDRKKESGNAFVYIIIVLLGLFVFFIDDIVNHFTGDNDIYYNNANNDIVSNNLVDGFIKYNENNSFVKVEKIKFYNFKQASTGKISFNYESDKYFKDVSKEKIYLEIYDSNQDIIYKELFNPNAEIERNAVREYSIDVDALVYQDAFYSKVLVYTKEELSKEIVLECNYEIKNDDLDLLYNVKYNFVNNELVAYNVDKKFASKKDSASSQYKNELKNEFLEINNFNVKSTYTDTSLKYTLNLTSIDIGLKSYYKLGTTPKIIYNKETNKKWKCQ